MIMPVCEACLNRNSKLHTIGDRDSHDYMYVCDNCKKSMEWVEETSWAAAVDGDESLVWERDSERQ